MELEKPFSMHTTLRKGKSMGQLVVPTSSKKGITLKKGY